jgi:BolA protein
MYETMSDRRTHIENKLRRELNASEIEVVDESHLHAGHVGAREGGGHFRVTVVSQKFAGLGRLQAQRLVYKILEDEMKSEIHALSIKAAAPSN